MFSFFIYFLRPSNSLNLVGKEWENGTKKCLGFGGKKMTFKKWHKNGKLKQLKDDRTEF